MKKEIRVLMVEDASEEADLIQHALRVGGLTFRIKRVETKARFLYELKHDPPDLILSDFGLARLDGFTALAIARKARPNTPFVLISGAMGVSVMIDSLNSGATGCVLKRRLETNLPPVVRRALSAASNGRCASMVRLGRNSSSLL
ncbi:MAG: response regulator [Verrucomicrobia bacterium]|nr:response regulator [Verrucomicrobiota bacterium]